MNKILHLIIAYDIIEDKRRAKVATILEDYGERIQYSVFSLHIDKERLKEMRARISDVFEETEDKISFFFLCEECLRKAEHVGAFEFSREPEVYII